jgi:ribosome-associated protein
LRCALKSIEKARAVVTELEAKKAEKILLLDIHEIASFTDYFIICNGTSDRMLHALAAVVRDYAKAELKEPLDIEGDPREGWLVVDMGDVVVHLFSEEMRDYYKLEQLWNKGKRLLSLQ